MNRETGNLISLVGIFTFIFVVGLWTIDINFSLANFEAVGFEGKIGSLLFEDVDTRVSYHLGILLTVIGFFGINAVHLRYQTRRGQKRD